MTDQPGECPRCAFRRTMQAPPPEPSAPLELPNPPDTQQAATSSRRRSSSLLLAVAAPVLAFMYLYHLHATQPITPQAKIRTLFAAAVRPCREGQKETCLCTIREIRGMNDDADASLLLGDMNIAFYLHTLPNGPQLNKQWLNNQITAPELAAFGNTAYSKNLVVWRSFRIYVHIESEHTPIPLLYIVNPNSYPPQFRRP